MRIIYLSVNPITLISWGLQWATAIPTRFDISHHRMCKHTVMCSTHKREHTYAHTYESLCCHLIVWLPRSDLNSHVTRQYPRSETGQGAFISRCCWWQLMSVMWWVPAPGWGCGGENGLEVSIAWIYRPRRGGGGEGGACLLAEKLWNSAKFSIREPSKVTPVCGPCAKRPGRFSLS